MSRRARELTEREQTAAFCEEAAYKFEARHLRSVSDLLFKAAALLRESEREIRRLDPSRRPEPQAIDLWEPSDVS